MIISSDKQLIAVSFDTATYQDLQCFVSDHPEFSIDRIDPHDFLTSNVHQEGSYINLVLQDFALRKKITQHLDVCAIKRFSLIHDSVCHKHADIAPGCFLYPMTTLYPRVKLERDVIIHSQNGIAHECKIGVGTILSGCIGMGGNTTVGDFVFIGAGATLFDKISIVSDTVIGAGTVVRKNIYIPGTYTGQSKIHLIKSRLKSFVKNCE